MQIEQDLVYKIIKMKKLQLAIFFFCAFLNSNAQTGIGTTTPNASAKLDVYSTNKGFLPPRVTLTSATDATTIASPAEGLLVYNLGSTGLQAGYYYWNNANWATIATATSAGNGAASMDMVKLYGEVHSKASGKIGNSTTGFLFSVPVSGRYLFDFTSAATTLYGGTNTIYFTVRQGTTVLASDMQSSYNNNVHVEYNGKVEVNLQAGVSYNVYNYATSGSFETSDYDRVYYKLVAGNLPVTGQSVDYIQASLSTNQALSAAGNINFNTSSGTGISITSGGFNLIANKTYKLEAAIGGTSGGYAYYAWVDNSNNLLPGGSIGAVMKAGTAYTDAPQDKAVVYFTPIVDTRVFLRVYSLSGTLTAYAPSTSSNYSSSWANISQIGSSAFVNPWTLSGTSTYNTTGNVGIGTNTPAYSLDISGTAKLTTTPTITTASNVLVKDPTTSQISEQPISFITGVSKFIRNTNQGTLSSGTTVIFNSTSNNTISSYVALNTSTGVITLQPGTYELNGSVGALGGSSGSNGDSRIYPVFHNGTSYVGTGGVSETGPAGNWNGMPQNNANYIITVSVGQTAQLTLKAAIVNNVSTLSETGDYGAIGDAGRAWVVVRKYN